MPLKKPIDWISVNGFYDHPIDGWLRVEGQRLFFSIDWESGKNRKSPLRYFVYRVPKRERIPYLQDHRRFRHLVTWMWDYKPNTAFSHRTIRQLDGTDIDSESVKPNYNEYYNTKPHNTKSLETKEDNKPLMRELVGIADFNTGIVRFNT